MPKEIQVKSILNKTKRRDDWFLDDYTINMYSSCSFNCLYCYIRGSKYGANLEESLSAKINGIEILDRQLFNRAKKGQFGYIVISSATEPYLKAEADYQLTRQALELIKKYKFPLHIITKSDLVVRDFDLLHEIDKTANIPNDLKAKINRGAFITFSFSTVDDQVGKVFEKGATAPSERLNTLEKAITEGFYSGVSMMPLLPYISDTSESLHNMFRSFQKVGAKYVMPATLTLFGSGKADSKPLILKTIEKHFPELLPKYQKFFDHSDQVPDFYQKAFYIKMKELSSQYGISDRILA